MRRSRVRLGSHLLAQSETNTKKLSGERFFKIAGVIFLVAAFIFTIKSFTGDDGGKTADLPEEKTVLGAQTEAVVGQDYFYEVQKSDSLFSISERFRVNWEDIVDLNGLREPFSLQPGQKIKLPTSEVTERQKFYENLKNKIYAVEEGDTFVGIAQKLNVSVTELLRANPDLPSPDFISIGQALNLP